MGIKYGLHPEEYYNKSPESYKEIVKVKKKSTIKVLLIHVSSS